MQVPDHIRTDFERMIERSEERFDLARAALLVAAESDPKADIDGSLGVLDRWAEELRGRLDPSWNNLQKLARLRAFLFEDLGFRGDRTHYYSPRNSFLHDVIERRRGVPLTMAIVMMELGWRVGIPFEGVGFPGHFLVRLAGEPADLLLDPFSRGMTVHREECVQMLEESSGGRLQFEDHLLESIGKRQMIERLLHNLKGAYLRSDDDEGALLAVDRLLLIDPENLAETRDRGLLLFRMRRYSEAIECLKRYCAGAPDAPDHGLIERHVNALRQLIASMN